VHCGGQVHFVTRVQFSVGEAYMIRRHYGDALVLMASFTGGSILMFGLEPLEEFPLPVFQATFDRSD